ncbi:MAG: AbrB/MazE/SpoVT family DNA-binding domain-containing protein [Methanolinea sp.]|jgi:hypothetical protein|nr:AbrB/MazE/SpoVT family DNA-binding domain-containing protein [Methanolinea sp.]
MVKIKETTLFKVNNKSDSLRTTIPREIIKLFELQEGSRIEWYYTPGHGVSIRVPDPPRQRSGGG